MVTGLVECDICEKWTQRKEFSLQKPDHEKKKNKWGQRKQKEECLVFKASQKCDQFGWFLCMSVEGRLSGRLEGPPSQITSTTSLMCCSFDGTLELQNTASMFSHLLSLPVHSLASYLFYCVLSVWRKQGKEPFLCSSLLHLSVILHFYSALCSVSVLRQRWAYTEGQVRAERIVLFKWKSDGVCYILS